MRSPRLLLQAECEEVLSRLLSGRAGRARLAVASALLARYYKRVEAHLGNIVDILVTPVSEGGLAPPRLAAEQDPADHLPFRLRRTREDSNESRVMSRRDSSLIALFCPARHCF